jgi:hypothetical protein
MENNKLEGSEIVGVVSQHAGALVGAAVAAGKRTGDCVSDMMAASGVANRLAERAGALLGAAVAAGRRLWLRIRQTLAPEKGPS